MEDFPLLDVFFTILWFYVVVALLWFLITLMTDVFRSPDLSGLSKALWMLFLLVVPVIAAIVYLVARGDRLHQRQVDDMAGREAALRRRMGVPSSSPADELSKLVALRDSGILSEDEFQAQKVRLLAP